jgi:hypothetical protein
MALVVSRSLNGATSIVDATAWGMPAESGTAAGNWAGAAGLMPITA